MNEPPEPPEWLFEPARNAFFRIHKFLAARQLWDDLYLSSLGHCSQVCAVYLAEAAASSGPDSEIEAKRIVARQFLANFYYIPQNRIHLAAFNSDGLDSDIAELCKPAH